MEIAVARVPTEGRIYNAGPEGPVGKGRLASKWPPVVTLSQGWWGNSAGAKCRCVSHCSCPSAVPLPQAGK